jgi:hypothetical protein
VLALARIFFITLCCVISLHVIFVIGCGRGTSVDTPEGTVNGSENGCQWTGLTLKQRPRTYTFKLSAYHINISNKI